MKKWLLSAALTAVVLGLVGCAKDNTIPPTPLSQVAPNLIQTKVVWSEKIGSGNHGQYLPFNPVVYDNQVFTTSYDGTVTAVNAATGQLLWKCDLPFHMGTGPSVYLNTVVVSGLNGEVVALMRNNGRQLWTAQMNSSVLAPVAINHTTVVVHAHNGDVAALDVTTGKQLWVQSNDTPALSLANDGQPVISGKRVIVGFDNGVLTAYKLSNGQVIWSRPIAIASGDTEIARMIDVVATPVVQNGVVYAVGYHGNAVALRLDNGSLLWEHPISTYSNFAFGQGVLLITDDTGAIYALDQQTGRVLWVQKALLWRSVSAPALVNAQAAVVGDYAGYVHWLSLSSGQLLARTQVSGKGIMAQPATANGLVFVVTNGGELLALKSS